MQITQRIMLFVDGENLVFRFQSMVDNGFVPHENIIHIPNIFIWSPQISAPGPKHQVMRAFYYTSVTGDENRITEIKNQIKDVENLTIRLQGGVSTLYPIVMKKPRQSYKTKRVDIQMTTDILKHVYQDNLDIAYLFTGDEDFIPVINEVIRLGKIVYLASFSDGLNPSLKHEVDTVVDLDSVFFEPSKS